MRIVVSDSSCLIDLRKVSMLDLLLKLPYEFLIPNTLLEEELLKFTVAQKKSLIRSGLKVVDLPGEARPSGTGDYSRSPKAFRA
jgi:predicted nucleic acid-binding protein